MCPILKPGKSIASCFRASKWRQASVGTCRSWSPKGSIQARRSCSAPACTATNSNPTDVVQRSFAELDPARMSGTVLAVLDIARPAMEQIRRKWPTPVWGGEAPRPQPRLAWSEDGNVAQRQAWLVWNRLFKGNVDAALEFHTAPPARISRSSSSRTCASRRTGRLPSSFPVAQIKDDAGYSGTLETAFMEAGIPAITPGGRRRAQL